MRINATLLAIVFLVSSSSAHGKAVQCVENFDVERYLGTWYEIARLDHSFERGLDEVTATYSWNDNGTIKVTNRGYNTKKGKWNEAVGKAKFKGDEDIGALKVSFFGPFYAGYNIVALDEDYSHALVAGPSTKYLWVLSRTAEMDEKVYLQLLKKATEMGYDTSKLIEVKHTTEKAETNPEP